jgi:hypothetical protein
MKKSYLTEFKMGQGKSNNHERVSEMLAFSGLIGIIILLIYLKLQL